MGRRLPRKFEDHADTQESRAHVDARARSQKRACVREGWMDRRMRNEREKGRKRKGGTEGIGGRGGIGEGKVREGKRGGSEREREKKRGQAATVSGRKTTNKRRPTEAN
eukprot:3900747-Pleurochrysis_carterae.AAC.2